MHFAISLTFAVLGLTQTVSASAIRCLSGDEFFHKEKFDSTTQQVRDLTRTPQPYPRSPETGHVSDNEHVIFWCLTGAGDRPGDGSLDLNDFEYATSELDRVCGPYKPAYFQWDSDEVVGRSWSYTDDWPCNNGRWESTGASNPGGSA